jgi:hypothetical protein
MSSRKREGSMPELNQDTLAYCLRVMEQAARDRNGLTATGVVCGLLQVMSSTFLPAEQQAIVKRLLELQMEAEFGPVVQRDGAR